MAFDEEILDFAPYYQFHQLFGQLGGFELFDIDGIGLSYAHVQLRHSSVEGRIAVTLLGFRPAEGEFDPELGDFLWNGEEDLVRLKFSWYPAEDRFVSTIPQRQNDNLQRMFEQRIRVLLPGAKAGNTACTEKLRQAFGDYYHWFPGRAREFDIALGTRFRAG